MKTDIAGHECSLEWKAVEGSKFYQSPKIYKDNGFLEEKDADDFLAFLQAEPEEKPLVEKIERKKETKNPPLLYNLAELQNDCSKLFKISPDETLRIAQELYEKKLTTYPRTDARVLSTAVSKEIGKNIRGLQSYPPTAPFAERILKEERFKGIAKTRYVNDKQITDHYAIIPTGQGLSALNSLHPTSAKVYEIIARRFLSVFYPAAVYQKITLSANAREKPLFPASRCWRSKDISKLRKILLQEREQRSILKERAPRRSRKVPSTYRSWKCWAP